MGVFFLLGGIGAICYGLLTREFRQGRYGQGDIITSGSKILAQRIQWTAFGIICVCIAVYAFTHR